MNSAYHQRTKVMQQFILKRVVFNTLVHNTFRHNTKQKVKKKYVGRGKVFCKGGGFLFWRNGVKEFPFPFSTWLTHPSVPSPYFSARNNLEANGVIMCGLFQMENAHLSTSDLNQTRGQFSPLQSLPQRLMSFCQVCLAWAPHLWHVSAG